MKITMDEEGCPSTPNSFTLRVQFLVSYLFLVPRDTTCLCLYSYLRTLDLHAVVSCVYSVIISFTSRCSSFLVLSLGPDWNLRVCFIFLLRCKFCVFTQSPSQNLYSFLLNHCTFKLIFLLAYDVRHGKSEKINETSIPSLL